MPIESCFADYRISGQMTRGNGLYLAEDYTLAKILTQQWCANYEKRLGWKSA